MTSISWRGFTYRVQLVNPFEEPVRKTIISKPEENQESWSLKETPSYLQTEQSMTMENNEDVEIEMSEYWKSRLLKSYQRLTSRINNSESDHARIQNLEREMDQRFRIFRDQVKE